MAAPEEQAAVAGFLDDPRSYGPPVEAVERIETHAALVFLAGRRVYKVKRAVRFSFMDFSTLQKRLDACIDEVRLNRRTAPDLYLGLVPLLAQNKGVAWGELVAEPAPGLTLPAGALEVAVVMRRFEQACLFDRLAARGALDAGLIEALAREVTALHARAEPAAAPFGGAEGLRRVIEENAEDFAGFPDLFAPDRIDAFLAACRTRLAETADLLDGRRADGLVRRCHGDLHLRNIVLHDGRPTLFDCIEFNESIATIDLGYDIAFLLMDLDHRGLRGLANVALNRYLDAAARAGLGGPGWLAALPLFLGLRAAVRAKVTAPAVAAQEDPDEAARLAEEAGDYLAAAERYLQPPPPRLVAIGGLSGTGKSTLARRLAPALGASPGAVVLRSDQLRKRLAGVPETAALPEEAYAAMRSDQVYGEMARLSAILLEGGHSVVVDAVCAQPRERGLFEAVARMAGARFDGLWLEAPAQTLIARVGGRAADASDADADVVRRQLTFELGEIGWPRVETQDGPDATCARARTLLDLA